MSYYIVCSLLFFIYTMSAYTMEAKEIKMARRPAVENITFYETSNRGVFAEQYQLIGTILVATETETLLTFLFSGVVQMTISGAQLGATNYNFSCLKWQVADMPVRVSRWNDEESVRWGTVSTTYEKFVEIARDMSVKKEKMKMAIQLPKFVFAANGDLIWVEADQVVLKRLEGATAEVTAVVSQSMSSPVADTTEQQCQDAFDLERAREIVNGTVSTQMIEKVTIYHKWFDDGPEDGLHVAGVFDKESDILSLISALKQSCVPPEPKDPLIKCGNWSGFEFHFKCKDHRDAVLSVFVFDGYYRIVGQSNSGERYSTLVHQENADHPVNERPRCFFAQNLLIGKWLEAHGLPFREGTKKKAERKDNR
ncbi:MAG: hypothetical protein WC381_11035 [Kiritimatiellia bacterium]